MPSRASVEAAVRAAAEASESYEAEIEADVAEAMGKVSDRSNENVSRAASAHQNWQSEERQAEVEGFEQQARTALGMTEDGTLPDASPKDERQDTGHAVVFVSSSVPLHTLRAYAAQLDLIGGTMVLRGVPNGSMSKVLPLADFVDDVTRKDLRCEGADCSRYQVSVLLDPVLFRAAGVDMVPAVAIADGEDLAAYAEHEVEGAPRLANVTYGDAHLSGHFETQARRGVRGATELLTALEKGIDR